MVRVSDFDLSPVFDRVQAKVHVDVFVAFFLDLKFKSIIQSPVMVLPLQDLPDNLNVLGIISQI